MRGENHNGELYVIYRASSTRNIRLADPNDDFFTTSDLFVSVYIDTICGGFSGYDKETAPCKMIASEAAACYNR
jgi:hypothetical protein